MSVNVPTSQTLKQWGLLKFIFIFASLSVLGLVVFGAALYFIIAKTLPPYVSTAEYKPLLVTQVIAAGGGEEKVVGEFFKERRYVIPFEKMPKKVLQAFIAAEDEGFFEHQGISPMAILRASLANFKAGQMVQGGSTITQQVAKSLFLTPERKIIRKIKEAILAARIERNLTKEQILFLYLNQIYLGHGAYGVQAASLVYFNKDVSKLTLPEAALLAALPKAPTRLSPLIDPKRAKERQLYVLKRMLETGQITEAEMSEAAAQPIKVYQPRELNTQYSGYYVEQVRRYLVEKYGDQPVFEEGLRVLIPTRAALLRSGQKSVHVGLRDMDKRIGYRGPIEQIVEEEKVQAFLEKSREELIRKKVPFILFLPDGRLGLVEAAEAENLKQDDQLLIEGELYQAVVLSVDNTAKKATVGIGRVQVSLPFENLSWAKKPNTEDKVSAPPRFISDVLTKGDVIWVSFQKKAEPTPKEAWVAALEQKPEAQGAVFSLEAATGNVLAMEGGYDFEKSEFNRAIQASRQPGSAFKPIIFSAAIENGFTPASIIVDAPIVYSDEETGKWKPNNFEEKFYGDTTFRLAFIKSRNIPTIKLVQDIQVPNLISYARRLGMVSKFQEDLSISLGSATTSLVELTSVYAIFPRFGRKVVPIFIQKVFDRDGKLLEENMPKATPMYTPPTQEELVAQQKPSEEPSSEDAEGGRELRNPAKILLPTYPPPNDPDQVMDPRVAFVMTHLMKEVVGYGTGVKAQGLGRPAAGKTGTTSDSKDAWFIGFTPQVVTGSWVGFDDQRSMGKGETGSSAALPIWLEFMKEAVKPFPVEDFRVPAGVVFVSIDSRTGRRASEKDPEARVEAFIQGTEPTGKPTRRGEVIDNQGEFLKEDF